MKTTPNALLIIAVLIGLTTACEQDPIAEPIINTQSVLNVNSDGSIGNVDCYTSGLINTYLSSRAPQEQYFTLTAGVYDSIIGEKGTKLYMNYSSFTDNLGNYVSGEVEVTFIELLTKKDMLYAGKPTVSNGDLLHSAGAFYFSAHQNGEEISIGDIYIKIPKQVQMPSNPTWFSGETDSTGAFNWVLDNTNNGMEPYSPIFFYDYILGYLGNGDLEWLNCDAFYDVGVLYSLDIMAADNLGNHQDMHYIFFDDHNAVLKPYVLTNGTSLTEIPPGNVTILGLRERNGQLYAAKVNVAVWENTVVELEYDPVTEEDLDLLIEGI